MVEADRHELITVRGARENNLRNIDVDIPKRKLTVRASVSGSGKSSLVFGTIAAESQRLINETYSAFVQGFMPSIGRPDVDSLENLSAAFIVDQERMGANSRSTLGTATDHNAMLRIVFSRLGDPQIGPSFYFGFNPPEGMCPASAGLGHVIDIDELFDASKTLNDGAITIPRYSADGWLVRTFTESGLVPGDVLVDSGKTVIVIEHHQAVMAHADWIIDIGPGAGQDGGEVVFTGSPASLVAAASTLTGQHLKEYVRA